MSAEMCARSDLAVVMFAAMAFATAYFSLTRVLTFIEVKEIEIQRLKSLQFVAVEALKQLRGLFNLNTFNLGPKSSNYSPCFCENLDDIRDLDDDSEITPVDSEITFSPPVVVPRDAVAPVVPTTTAATSATQLVSDMFAGDDEPSFVAESSSKLTPEQIIEKMKQLAEPQDPEKLSDDMQVRDSVVQPRRAAALAAEVRLQKIVSYLKSQDYYIDDINKLLGTATKDVLDDIVAKYDASGKPEPDVSYLEF